MLSQWRLSRDGTIALTTDAYALRGTPYSLNGVWVEMEQQRRLQRHACYRELGTLSTACIAQIEANA